MNGLMDGWTDRQTYKKTDGQTDLQVDGSTNAAVRQNLAFFI
jgi:hypothetical protein